MDLHNYEKVARVISETVDPLQDIHFIKGPVDILDHSSRQYAFGSKMGIDATEKLGEEYGITRPASFHPAVDKVEIRKTFSGTITSINDSFLEKGISVLILSVNKTRPGQLREISRQIVLRGWIRDVKFILFTDDSVDIFKISDVVWIGANNMDPMRDCFLVNREDQVPYPGLFMDGTRKSREFDDFERDWPNVIIMDDETIRAIDQKWDNLGLGPFIPSPSLQYKSLVVNKGAVML
jgi:4-hydroxy-3-polyprenylbenzoate decarboxylase